MMNIFSWVKLLFIFYIKYCYKQDVYASDLDKVDSFIFKQVNNFIKAIIKQFKMLTSGNIF